MPATHLSLHCHIVFSTKNRHRFLEESWLARFHQYVGGLICTAGGVPEAIGGVDDHMYLLVGLRATHMLSSLVQDIKQTSSAWVQEAIG